MKQLQTTDGEICFRSQAVDDVLFIGPFRLPYQYRFTEEDKEWFRIHIFMPICGRVYQFGTMIPTSDIKNSSFSVSGYMDTIRNQIVELIQSLLVGHVPFEPYKILDKPFEKLCIIEE